MVDLMGGTISVRSRLNAGTTFTVRLHGGQCAAGKLWQRRQSGSGIFCGRLSLKGKHILLCEDHPLNQEIARALLSEKGHDHGYRRRTDSAASNVCAILLWPIMMPF
jgi:hypothetical protein